MLSFAPMSSRRATYQDVLDAPPNKVAQIFDGVLYLQSRPAKPHARANTALGADLHQAYDRGRNGPGGWHILFEPEVHIGGDIVVPDLAGWRIDGFEDDLTSAYFTTAPDWVCEILSPSTARLDRTKKRARYARSGVSHLWFVDPLARTLVVHELDGESYRIVAAHADEEEVACAPFDAATLPLADYWVPGA